MIEKIVGKRQSGRTTHIVRQAAATGAIIICPSYRAVIYVREVAAKQNIEIVPPITVDEFIKNYKQHKNKMLIMDDAELCLSMMGIVSIVIEDETFTDIELKSHSSVICTSFR